MRQKDSLIFLESNRRCSSKLCNEIGWKLPSHEFCSVAWLVSYGNWLSKTFYGGYILALLLATLSSHGSRVLLRAGASFWIYYTLF